MTVVSFTAIHPKPGDKWDDLQKLLKRGIDLARKHGAENVTVLATMIFGPATNTIGVLCSADGVAEVERGGCYPECPGCGGAVVPVLHVAAGANVKAVQRMLGHARASMTLDVYADLFDVDLDVVAAKLDTAIESAADALRTGTTSPAR